jgi:lipoate---protein ligase
MTAHEGRWVRHDWLGSAEEFHSLQPEFTRAVWWCQVTQPALILGSSQSINDVDTAVAGDAGINIVQRRSGGGAVWVHPQDSVWIDVTIPRTDPLWTDDVTTSMLWLGEVFRRALSQWVTADVHTEAYASGPDGKSVCFASVSPGEVFVGGNKLVGISQRRTREGARLQCVLYRSWDPSTWAQCLSDAALRDRVMNMSAATLDAVSTDIVDAVVAAMPVA